LTSGKIVCSGQQLYALPAFITHAFGMLFLTSSLSIIDVLHGYQATRAQMNIISQSATLVATLQPMTLECNPNNAAPYGYA
jgi:hypothetical protein